MVNQKQNQIKKIFGRRVRALRTKQGLTQEELGEKSSLDYKYLGGVERGERNPGLINILKIAHGLNVSLDELFTLDHEVPDTRALREEITDLLESSSETDLRVFYRVIKAVFG
ncbi:MAG: helix-turn-helix domain-containing protein [Proteobacteria bacterium]|nr:helix-turn-helix domain-containing protein [Pseudomonadota bacterium]